MLKIPKNGDTPFCTKVHFCIVICRDAMNEDQKTEREKVLTLADVPTGEYCVIVRVTGHGSFRHRLSEKGSVSGRRTR